MQRWAFLQTPRLGGTYSVFRALRPALGELGISLRWAGMASGTCPEIPPELQAESRWGSFVNEDSSDTQRRTHALYDHLTNGSYDGVIVNVLCGALETNMARYLPTTIPRILVVHSTTRGTYLAARAVRDYVMATVAVSPRIRNDLIRWYGFSHECITVVPNALPEEPMVRDQSVRAMDAGRISVLSLGRIEDSSKGILLLPEIMRRVGGCEWHLTVAGEGPDLEALKRACQPLGDQVTFIGAVSPAVARHLFAQHDVFLMPSRYEGFGIALIEAMAAGCVPVVSRINGVTDWIVNDGQTGLLFPIGDATAAAERIRMLALASERLCKLALDAKESAVLRFHPNVVGRQFAGVLERAVESRATPAPPLDMRDWRLPRGLRRGLRSMLPGAVKIRLRSMWERFAP